MARRHLITEDEMLPVMEAVHIQLQRDVREGFTPDTTIISCSLEIPHAQTRSTYVSGFHRTRIGKASEEG
jgi:hypothetical protein